VLDKVLGRIAIVFAVTAVVSFGLSNVLLEGEDPAGWWNIIPAFVFYATVFVLIPALGVVALVAFAVSAARKHRCR